MSLSVKAVPLSLRVKPEIRKKLKIRAKNDNRSLSQMASIMLERFIKEEEKKEEALKIALIQADKDLEKAEFISQEAMYNWIDSLETENELPIPKEDVFFKKSKNENSISQK